MFVPPRSGFALRSDDIDEMFQAVAHLIVLKFDIGR